MRFDDFMIFLADGVVINQNGVKISILYFSLLALACSFVVKKVGWRTLPYVGGCIILCLIRLVTPIQFPMLGFGIFDYGIISDWAIRVNIWFRQDFVFGLSRIDTIRVTMMLIMVGAFIVYVISLLRQFYLCRKWELPVEHPLAMFCRAEAERLGCGVRVRICLAHIDSPMMTGFFRPSILIPKAMEYTDPEELSYILRHELAHFQGHDIWLRLAVDLLTVLFWWNPAAYILRNSITHALELRSDARACRDLGREERMQYAEVIAAIARSIFKKRGLLATSWLGKRKNRLLQQRIGEVLHLSKAKTRTGLVLFAAAFTIFVFSYFYNPGIACPRIPGEEEWLVEPPEEEKSSLTFILDYPDGKLVYVVDGIPYAELSPEDLDDPPDNTLDIYDVNIEEIR